MALVIGLLTLVMVLDCLVLILLVLIQLPKKEAGAGLAFGGSATDALFGAGSGTVLTKITKYAAGIFFVLALILSIMQSRYHGGRAKDFGTRVGQSSKTTPGVVAPAPTPASKGTPSQLTGTNATIQVGDTNAVLKLTTNNAAAISTNPAATSSAPK